MSLFDQSLFFSLSLSNLLQIYLSHTPSTLLLSHPHLPLRPRIFNFYHHLHTQAMCEMTQPQLQLLYSDLITHRHRTPRSSRIKCGLIFSISSRRLYHRFRALALLLRRLCCSSLTPLVSSHVVHDPPSAHLSRSLSRSLSREHHSATHSSHDGDDDEEDNDDDDE